MEERRKEQEKLEVSPLGGGGEVSQSLLNGTWWGQASSHGECFNAWYLPSLPQGGRAEDQGEMSPHYLGEHGPSWRWLG